MSEQMPDSPFTELMSGAIQMHELMMSFVEAGFTNEQAFAMLQNILSSHIMAAGRSGD